MSRKSLFITYSCATVLMTGVTFLSSGICRGQETSAAELSSEENQTEENQIVVPEGDAGVLIKFIEEIANPKTMPETRDEMRAYMRKVSVSIAEAADKILAGEATDQQLVDGVEWKLESFRVRRHLGDRDADQDQDKFFESLEGDERTSVIKAFKRAKLRERMNVWPRLSEKQHETLVNDFVETVKTHGPTWEDAIVANRLGRIADFGDGERAVKAINELMPIFREASDPEIDRMLPNLEGRLRALNLLGSKLELEGKFLDGSELDWESYRGKVVLVDFWATWCGPCRAEVPNVLANYAAYHDKGFEVLGISLDETREDAQKYIQQQGILWKSVFSNKPGETGWEAPMAVRYSVGAIPKAILVDQEGKVVHLEARGRLLGLQLQKLLGDPSTEVLSSDTPSSDTLSIEEASIAGSVQE